MIPLYAPEITGNAWTYIQDCLNTGWVSTRGNYVRLFEEHLAAYLGVRYAIATQSGTAALHLALSALDIGSGDQVIVPALTYVASANAVTYVGAKPVFVDSEAQAGTLDPALIESMITPRTRAIMPVHLYGHPADMDAICALAHRYSLTVVEDAASALGARYWGQPVGTLGNFGCFSFFANKLITTGTGGVLVTNDPKLATRAVWLSNHAQDRPGDYVHGAVGFNYRMNAVQAALGLAQIEQVDEFLRRKREHARDYDELLASVPGVLCPTAASWATHSYGLYSIRLTDEYPRTALELREALQRREIETRPFFVPLKDLLPYRNCPSTLLPVARAFRQSGLSLPSSVGLTLEEIRTVTAAIREFGESA